MTDNATGDKADAEGAAAQRGSDDAIAFTPITVPDREHRERSRHRRRTFGMVAAAVVVAGGITAWVIAAHGGDGEPVKHTAVIPKAYGKYTQVTKPEDSLWKGLDGDNLDPSKAGGARITYAAPDGTAAMVSVSLDPPDFTSDDGVRFGPGSDSFTESLLGVDDLSGMREYPAGKAGGKIQCADPSTHGVSITICAWQDKAVDVTYTPARDGKTVVDHDAAAGLRAFLDALTIEPKKS
ncbi:hypothetical protein [Streptomyces sp. NPDC049040]|uniref:hypothetical protein n=1 Tax=Streptomyces sp. NPDC049040 TaxID=3365593 RepID=UPI0037219580